MQFSDLLAPLRRHQNLYLLLFVVFSVGLFFSFNLMPKTQKTTIYFSVKPLQTESNKSTNLDPVESAMKITDMISGWAKNPAFRNEILQTAEVDIPHFKRKITARKQNRTNVFWTLSLNEQETQHSEKIIQSTIDVFNRHFEEFNEQNAFPFQYTKPQIFSETKTLPKSWILLISLFLGLTLSGLVIYANELLKGKTSFVTQIKNIFPDTPLLKISEKIEQHDGKLLERFITRFESPQLIGTFPKAEDLFSLTSQDELNDFDTPILLIHMGKTELQELENLKAIFGKNIALVVFDA